MTRPAARLFTVLACAPLLVVVAPAVGHAEAEPAPIAPSSAPQSSTVTSSRRTAGEWVVYRTNQHRRQRGLVPLRIARGARRAALFQSTHQANIDRMTHTGPKGGNAGHRLTHFGYRWRLWGENVAAGQLTSATVVRAWMRSPGHRANMLNPRARHIGAARRYSGDGTPYWTLVIAARS